MISLSDIIKQALPFVSQQLEEEVDKYDLEKELRQNSPRYDSHYMPQIIKKWGIEEDEIILIEYVGHDLNTRAFTFEKIEDLETRLLGPSSFLHGLICYVIPVVKGRVQTFKLEEKTIIWENPNLKAD